MWPRDYYGSKCLYVVMIPEDIFFLLVYMVYL